MTLITQSTYCISSDYKRNYASVGFLHSPSSDKLRLACTDGYRLSYAEMEFDKSSELFKEGIGISKKGLLEILKLCRSSQENCSCLFLTTDVNCMLEIETTT